MRYNNVLRAKFVERLNRFIAKIQVFDEKNGVFCEKFEFCHVKNTGRLGELLVSGAEIYIQKSENPQRKTAYDLIGVVKDGSVVNIDSLAPNIAVGEYLMAVYPEWKIIPEKKFGNSRFDFYLEKGDEKGFIEVKGVTLFRDGRALFPDAPTERGVKHLDELCICKKQGYFAKVFFIIAADTDGKIVFSPNRSVGTEFAEALTRADKNGVEICAFDCEVGWDSMSVKNRIRIELEY